MDLSPRSGEATEADNRDRVESKKLRFHVMQGGWGWGGLAQTCGDNDVVGRGLGLRGDSDSCLCRLLLFLICIHITSS